MSFFSWDLACFLISHELVKNWNTFKLIAVFTKSWFTASLWLLLVKELTKTTSQCGQDCTKQTLWINFRRKSLKIDCLYVVSVFAHFLIQRFVDLPQFYIHHPLYAGWLYFEYVVRFCLPNLGWGHLHLCAWTIWTCSFVFSCLSGFGIRVMLN